MQRAPKFTGFEQQLEAYSATSKSIASASNWRDRLGSWPIYTAATASALACATSASAGIIYSGLLNDTVRASGPTTTVVHFPASALLHLNVATFTEHGKLYGLAGEFGDGHGGDISILHSAQRNIGVAPNAPISGGYPRGVFASSGYFWFESAGKHYGAWGPASPTTAFAGIRFSTALGSRVYDYGWLRISITASEGYPITMTLIDYAYNSAIGQSINAGQEASTPEPDAKAMMLLACGFAGVLAWRRHRKAAI